MHLFMIYFKDVGGEGALGHKVEVVLGSAQEAGSGVVGRVFSPIFGHTAIPAAEWGENREFWSDESHGSSEK